MCVYVSVWVYVWYVYETTSGKRVIYIIYIYMRVLVFVHTRMTVCECERTCMGARSLTALSNTLSTHLEALLKRFSVDLVACTWDIDRLMDG